MMWVWWVVLTWAAPDADRVAIANRLVADGLFDRAAAVLDELEEVPKDQAAEVHTLRGLVAMQLGDLDGAISAFDQAVATGEAAPLVHLQRAQALLGLERPAEALTALDLAGAEADSLPAAHQLRARALRSLERPDEAYAALLAARAAHPTHRGLAEDAVWLLVDLGLSREAADAGRALAEFGVDVSLWVAIGERLRRAGALNEAIPWLEEARLRYPDSPEARVALASACLDADRPRCAGEALAEAAAFDARYASEAAECFRRTGDLSRALYWNGLVEDEATKVRQRLGLLLEQGRFDQAAALEARLSRLGLLEDESLAYALAYAHVRTGDYPRAEALLRGLSDPRLFQQATALREAMARCAEDGSGCP
jgi:predicted Zn-dependent protease